MTSFPPLALNATREQLIERLEQHATEEARLGCELDDVRQELADVRALKDRAMRALNRGDALCDAWAADKTPTTRGEAAGLFATVIDLNGGWVDEPVTPGPQIRLIDEAASDG